MARDTFHVLVEEDELNKGRMKALLKRYKKATGQDAAVMICHPSRQKDLNIEKYAADLGVTLIFCTGPVYWDIWLSPDENARPFAGKAEINTEDLDSPRHKGRRLPRQEFNSRLK